MPCALLKGEVSVLYVEIDAPNCHVVLLVLTTM